MWNCDIDKSILDRIKITNDLNEFYFPNDKYQALPKEGYTKFINNILDHPNIKIELNTNFNKSMEDYYDHIFNSMPIDEYYDFCFGELPYRSIKFHNIDVIDFDMPTPVVNFTDEGPYTRITNWGLFPEHGDYKFTLEEPCDYKDNKYERYYPIKDSEGKNLQLYKKYNQMENPKVTFIGRTGTYMYLDMDMAIAIALNISTRF